MIRDSGAYFLGHPVGCYTNVLSYLLTYEMSARRHLSQMHIMNYTRFIRESDLQKKMLRPIEGEAPTHHPLNLSLVLLKVSRNECASSERWNEWCESIERISGNNIGIRQMY